MDPLYIPDSKNFDDLFIKSLNVANTNNLEYSTVISIRSVSSSLHKSKHVGKRKMPGATKQGSHVKQNANEQNVKQKSIGNKRSSKSSLKCNKCGKRFRKEVIMIKHMNEPKYQCEKCRQVFCRQVDLNRHIATVHRHPIYSCSICEYKSNNRRTLTDHFIRKHTECEHPSCNQELDIQDERKQRTNQVHSGESIICSICGRVCKSVHALKKHMKFRHYKPQLVCEICHRSLSTQRNFDLHLKWHETRETVRCPTCDKKCRVRDLKQHVQTHNNAKPFSCPVCDKLFRWQSTQEQHMLIHTGKRSYICSICGLAFVQKRGLIVHRREHPKPLPPLPVVPIKSIIEGFLKEYTKKNAAKKTK